MTPWFPKLSLACLSSPAAWLCWCVTVVPHLNRGLLRPHQAHPSSFIGNPLSFPDGQEACDGGLSHQLVPSRAVSTRAPQFVAVGTACLVAASVSGPHPWPSVVTLCCWQIEGETDPEPPGQGDYWGGHVCNLQAVLCRLVAPLQQRSCDGSAQLAFQRGCHRAACALAFPVPGVLVPDKMLFAKSDVVLAALLKTPIIEGEGDWVEGAVGLVQALCAGARLRTHCGLPCLGTCVVQATRAVRQVPWSLCPAIVPWAPALLWTQ
jgi:hypothetical protein